MSGSRVVGSVLAVTCLALGGTWVFAQSSAPSVTWKASAKTDPADAQGHRATLNISAVVPKGWHVYAQSQAPGGPTPLRITIEEGAASRIAGAPSGSIPERRHDPSFDLDTDFYSHAFTLRFPVEAQRSLADSPSLPVSVRFQLCSERECQPPKTIHLDAAIDAQAAS